MFFMIILSIYQTTALVSQRVIVLKQEQWDNFLLVVAYKIHKDVFAIYLMRIILFFEAIKTMIFGIKKMFTL